MPPLPSTPGPADGESASFAREDAGYHHDLKPRQLQMIAIGGAIGTGCSWAQAAGWSRRDPGCSWSTGSAAASCS